MHFQSNSNQLRCLEKQMVQIDSQPIDVSYIQMIDPFMETKQIVGELRFQINEIEKFQIELNININDVQSYQLRLYCMLWNQNRQRFEIKWPRKQIKLKIDDQLQYVRAEGLPVQYSLDKKGTNGIQPIFTCQSILIDLEVIEKDLKSTCQKITLFTDLRLDNKLYEFLKLNSSLTRHDKILYSLKDQHVIITKFSQNHYDQLKSSKTRKKCPDILTNISNQLRDAANQDRSMMITKMFNESKKEQIVQIIKGCKEDRSFMRSLELGHQEELANLFEEISKLELSQYIDFLNSIYDTTLELIPLDVPIQKTKDGPTKEPLLERCKELYKYYKIVFIPLMFWSQISERNVIKALNSLKFIHKISKSLPHPILMASTYFIYKFVHKKDIIFEFVYGKLFGYHIKQANYVEQSLRFTQFIENMLSDFPHLHLPTVTFQTKAEQSSYYKRLTSFYIGFFSWFNIVFIANKFRQVFAPPNKLDIATLEEKACLNLFVKQVLFRIIKGLKLSLSEVQKFYEIWDTFGAILKMNKGYKYGEVGDQVARFKQMLSLKRQQEIVKSAKVK
ncbi:UNKNOWN [Stylonychia lemnae]|uniref:Uncharacterized protein n=1 Tax=Stylonychia lemnae TaxID=5949 RepID=A0A078AHZ0_STYLE|nr:UNKNOWN [Stylonychia lemnae]|eukprot:CDW81864.1 UNKNOWN [Stylonychia lemnae]